MDTYHLVKVACCVKGCDGKVWVDAYPRKRYGLTVWDLSVEGASCTHIDENESDSELYDRVVGQMQEDAWDGND